ncbi:MAG: DUF2330 domain-containing protein [Planctomycetales bacterium]
MMNAKSRRSRFCRANQSRYSALRAMFAAAATLAGVSGIAQADPCGMVPPVYQGPGKAITRIGEQITCVFHKNGVETFVIRPGFQGKVDEFGMLIPFPNPPALRKVPDHLFQHVANAIDPPEVTVDMREFLRNRNGRFNNFSRPQQSLNQVAKDSRDVVRVIKKEAVGMYEVVVLEAGSAAALKKWMDEHKFKYPDGMDNVCNEYIERKWCFVAIKTKVGQPEGVAPQPGQRKVNSKLASGVGFDGHVQGMGFRFKSKELVVPMRLSAFNDGELRNIVYLVTDGPRKIRSIPEEYVVRQVSGKQLLKNVTQPLPLRILGGTQDDLRKRIQAKGHFQISLPGQFGAGRVDWNLQPAARLKQARDPKPFNGAAKTLFASDLLAVAAATKSDDDEDLSLPHEEEEKELLRIGERFGLRGADVDKLNAAVLTKQTDEVVTKAAAGIEDMTLTVVDGDFPREVLASKNLAFSAYRMPTRRNSPNQYDAKLKGPSPDKQGVLQLGYFELDDDSQVAAAPSLLNGTSANWSWLAGLLALVGLLAAGAFRAKAS